MQTSKSCSSEHSKSELLSPRDMKPNETVKSSLSEGDKQNSNISPQEQVSSNEAKATYKPTEISESYINVPFKDMGKFSFHIRDTIAAIIASATYTTLGFIDHFTDNSDIGKEFIKNIVCKFIYCKCQIKKSILLIGRANNCRSILATISVLILVPLILLIFLLITFMFGISSITIAFFAIVFFIFFVVVSFILVPVILTTSIFVGSLMLFISMCSKSDTWIQIIVLAVSYYLKKKIKNFADSFTNSDGEEKNIDIDGKPPQFDLPMSHVVVDTNNSSGYKVILEVNEPDPNAAELKDVLNKSEDIVIKDTSTEDTE